MCWNICDTVCSTVCDEGLLREHLVLHLLAHGSMVNGVALILLLPQCAADLVGCWWSRSWPGILGGQSEEVSKLERCWLQGMSDRTEKIKARMAAVERQATGSAAELNVRPTKPSVHAAATVQDT